MRIKEILQRNEISALEAEYMCEIVADLLKAYAEKTKETEPTAFNTIRDSEKAAEVVNDLGYMLALDYDYDPDDYDYEEDPEDDSYRSCADCPPEECDGHCMSCYYRSV